jgi:hypothetical protein
MREEASKRFVGWSSCVALAAVVACGPSSTVRTTRAGRTGGAGNEAGGAGGNGAPGGRAGTGGQELAGDGDSPDSGTPGGNGGADDCSSDPSAIADLSFTVNDGVLAGAKMIGATVFHFERSGDGLEVVIGSEGQAFRGPVTASGSLLEVESGLAIRDYGNPGHWPTDNGVTVENLSFCVHPPREGAAELDGTGKLLVVSNSDDVGRNYEVDAEFSGLPLDDKPPTLPASLTIDPLQPSALQVSEPLVLGAELMLVSPSGMTLKPVEQAGTVVAFLPTTILPLGFESEMTLSGTDPRPNSGVRRPDGRGGRCRRKRRGRRGRRGRGSRCHGGRSRPVRGRLRCFARNRGTDH